MKRTLLIFATLALLASAAGAQQFPNGQRPERPKMKTPEEIAKDKADRMQKEVGIDQKQYKKVYKLFKKDIEYRRDAMSQSFSGGMPPQGGPGMGGPGGGMGGPGGGPGMGGGMMGGPGGGMMGGPGGGMGGPGMGGPGMGETGGSMPPQGMGRPAGPGEEVVTEEYLEKQDQKLKKILSADQYEQWRAKHPAEHLQLPPMETTASQYPVSSPRH